jgi:hypothetical protein
MAGNTKPMHGVSAAWLRQTESKSSGYESNLHGIWEDRVGKSDRNPMLQLVAQLRRGGTDCAGNRNRQTDPFLQARAFLTSQARVNRRFGRLWDAATPAQVNEMVELFAEQLTQPRCLPG